MQVLGVNSMTRTARKGKRTSKEPLPATSWSKLRERPDKFQNEDGGSAKEGDEVEQSLRKVKRRELKLTKKSGIRRAGGVLKGLIEKVKKKKSGKRVRFALTETMPLLGDEDDQESDQPSGGEREKPSAPREAQGGTQTKGKANGILKKRKKKREKSKVSQVDEKAWLLAPSSDEDEATPESTAIGEENPLMEEPVVEEPVMEKKTHEGAARVKRKKEGGSGDDVDGAEKGKKPEMVDRKTLKKREARRLRRQKHRVCFKCRKSGHYVNQCPKSSGPAEICYRCGSGDHVSKDCKAAVPSGEYAYATCFICGETGHLSRMCPDNPRGIYPEGGGCKLCGSVEHKKANCPKGLRRKHALGRSQNSLGLVLANQGSADAVEFGDNSPVKTTHTPKSKHKIVRMP